MEQDGLAFFEGFMQTPPLWEGIQFELRQFEFPIIDLHAFKASPIPQKIRLGHQIEHVFRQLITFDDTYDIVLYNVPIRRNKRTLGEIDFVLKERETGQLIHVELTYKFYILDTNGPRALQELSGANRTDLFIKKLKKIKEKQFPLLHSPEGASALDEHGIRNTTISHQVCFKAQLFVPLGTMENTTIHPLNPACIIGEWMPAHLLENEPFLDHEYYIPSKQERVQPPFKDVDWEKHHTILPKIHSCMEQQNAVLLWQRLAKNEFRNYFIVWW